jgi:hypothetical protein
MTHIFDKVSRVVVPAIAVSAVTWGISTLCGAGFEESRKIPDSVEQVSPQQTVTPTPTPTPTPAAAIPQIDANGTITAPNGGRDAQFFIFDVENEQVTPQFLEGEFGYLDKRSHINFVTGKIETVTINGNQGAFTGTARIGGPRNRQTVQFTVTVTANQSPNPDTFSIVLSNGYAASGNLTSGTIVIRTLDPDP